MSLLFDVEGYFRKIIVFKGLFCSLKVVFPSFWLASITWYSL